MEDKLKKLIILISCDILLMLILLTFYLLKFIPVSMEIKMGIVNISLFCAILANNLVFLEDVKNVFRRGVILAFLTNLMVLIGVGVFFKIETSDEIFLLSNIFHFSVQLILYILMAIQLRREAEEKIHIRKHYL